MIIKRYPETQNKSLKAWSAADEYLLKSISEIDLNHKSIQIYHDRFGYLSVNLFEHQPIITTHNFSQKIAIQQNHKINQLDDSGLHFVCPLSNSEAPFDIALIKIPKSMDLFRLTLAEISKKANKDAKVYCGFMTRHFTKQMIEIASHYFEEINQSLAWKKARLLLLAKPKVQSEETNLIKTIAYRDKDDQTHLLQQYYGVFSGRHIDYATQFLLSHLKVETKVKTALDLACGNGVIGHHIRTQNPSCELHFLDDAFLAIESVKMNIKTGENRFHWADQTQHFEGATFDLIVCNPPFHFEHENTIDIALQMFEDAARILKKDGLFYIVANLHLNYKTHLTRIFNTVKVEAINSKFEIICCQNF